MLLVVDFSGLGLAFGSSDIRVDISAGYTVGKLLTKLSGGIEEICDTCIPDKQMLKLLDPARNNLDATQKLTDLALNDWDTIYIERRN